MFNKEAHKKMLNKAYKKILKTTGKTFFKDKTTGLALFILYLKYLRDSLIVEYFNDDSNTTPLASLIAAVAEGEAYINSDNDDGKKFHLDNFCEILKHNMEDWLARYDSI
jgi:hypothetical protein